MLCCCSEGLFAEACVYEWKGVFVHFIADVCVEIYQQEFGLRMISPVKMYV